MNQGITVDIHPVYAVVGGDRYLRQEALGALQANVVSETSGLDPARFDGAQAELADVLDEVRTLSLLGDRRVVIVDDADKFISANRAALERYASDPAECGTLILCCQTLPSRTRLYKIIQKSGRIITCAALKGRALTDWIKQRARTEYAKRLNPSAAESLRNHVGDDLGRLDAELSKLSAYVGDRSEINAEDIDALTGNHREKRVFAVTDAMATGDVSTALAHWEDVLATDRAAPGRAIGGLSWVIRTLLEARRARDCGATIAPFAHKLFIDPAALQRRLEAISAAQLESQLADLLAADLAVKTGGSSVDVAIEKFIVKHTAGCTEAS